MRKGNQPQRSPEAGYSMVELTVVLLIIMTLAVLTIPSLLGARAAAQEAAAVSAMRTIASCQLIYQLTYQGYAPTLQALGPAPRAGLPGPLAADLLDAELAAGLRSGYRFRYLAWDRNGDGMQETYTINAEPESHRKTSRYFFMDHSGHIRSEIGRLADMDSKPATGGIGLQ